MADSPKKSGDLKLTASPVTSADDASSQALNEALHGAKVKVPVLSGPAVTMVIPPGANAGQLFRLKGKGIPTHSVHPAGDQFVTLQIVLPDQADNNLAEIVKRWEAAHPYDPRKKFGEV